MRTPASLRLRYLPTKATQKLPALVRLISKLDPQPLRTIAYVPTCAMVDYFQHILPSLISLFHTQGSLQIISLHGKHKQQHREKNLAKFSNSASPSLLLTTDVAARGLDIPAVDLTVQLDPPADEKSFLHRAGRAGRAGRKGTAVVFLMPGREVEDYPAFLTVRKTPVSPLTSPVIEISDEEADRAILAIREVVLRDRALHEKAQQAFPSYVQAYRKHSASSIFRVSDLPWEELGRGWGLLKMPRMPEIKRWADGKIDLGEIVDWQKYKYKDKSREKARRAKMEEAREEVASESLRTITKTKNGDAWSRKRNARESREERREKKQKKRAQERESKMTVAERTQQAELKSLIEQVKQQNAVNMMSTGGNDEFNGFA